MKLSRLNAFISALASLRANMTDTEALTVPALFAEWREDGTHYRKDIDRVLYKGELYKCEQSHDSQPTWNPVDAHSIWTRIDDPSIEWPEWRQPTGSTDAYAFGAKVSHNGKHWISIIPANAYEPGVYGWDEAREE